jgi:glucose-6-phosphate isomerase
MCSNHKNIHKVYRFTEALIMGSVAVIITCSYDSQSSTGNHVQKQLYITCQLSMLQQLNFITKNVCMKHNYKYFQQQ